MNLIETTVFDIQQIHEIYHCIGVFGVTDFRIYIFILDKENSKPKIKA